MTAGHASIAAFGASLSYRHVAQVPAVDLAALLLAMAAWSLVTRIVSAATRSVRRADWVAPAFAAIRALGFARLAALVIPLQLLFLFAGEAYEQHFSGQTFASPLALFGSPAWYAPIVQLVIGAAIVLVTWWFAREVCRNANAAVSIVRAIVGRLSRSRANVGVARITRRFVPAIAASKPLARKFANRPPPFAVDFA
jgi:hypothetical protein